MSKPALKTALVTYGHTQPLKDGTVKPRTFEFAFEEVPIIIKAFRGMVRGLDFDISEMAMTTYLCAKAHGKAFTAIPVFPMRAFHHGAILVNTNAGIRSPKDLGRQEGRRQPRLHRHDRTLGAQRAATRVRRRSREDYVGAVGRRACRRVPSTVERGLD